MAFTIYALLKAGLLFLNAAAILHKERFLDKLGWAETAAALNDPMNAAAAFGAYPGGPMNQMQQPGSPDSMKMQFLKFVTAVQTIMRFPLIFINLFAIGLELLLG